MSRRNCQREHSVVNRYYFSV